MTLPTYSTGTASVANGGTTVTGIGTMWASGVNAREGDFFIRADGMALITEVTDDTHLQISPWPGATVVGGTLGITSDLAVNTNKFTVAAASGNTVVAGTLGVTGDLAVNTNKFTVAAASGNAAIAGTLVVTGNAGFVNSSPKTNLD